MKKIFLALFTILLIAGCASKPPASNPDEVSLNTAIRDAATRMESRLDRGTKIALINFSSPSQAFSEYVLDELSSVLVNNGHLVVVDRASLDLVRQELGFNLSGEVSDASAQSIGQMLGAQALVSGSLTSIADLRRVMFRVIITETAVVAVQHPADITNDRRVQALLAQGGGSRAVSHSRQGSATQTTQTPAVTMPAAPATQNRPKDGIYSFWPRLQATQAGRPVDAYLDKVIVSGNFITIYRATVPIGNGSTWFGHAYTFNNYLNLVALQDLDNPSRRPFIPISTGSEPPGFFIVFENITGKRFSLTSTEHNPPTIFREIIFGEPDEI